MSKKVKNGTTATPAKEWTVHLQLEKITEGAVRYMEVDEAGRPRRKDADGATLGTLYARKAALGTDFPKALTVIIRGQ